MAGAWLRNSGGDYFNPDEVAAGKRAGYENLAFEAVANRAGVTRNLVYHYFPGGKQQLLEASVHRAGEQLSSGWVTESIIERAGRMPLWAITRMRGNWSGG